MKVVKYFDTGKVIIGEISIKGMPKKMEVSYLRPDVDGLLVRFLAMVLADKYVTVLRPRQIEGGVSEDLVQVKFGDKLFWPSLDHSIGIIGYHLEK